MLSLPAVAGEHTGKLVLLSPSGVLSGAHDLAPQPLGSLWKAFVYAYLVETGQASPPYYCKGENAEEKFCCEKGKSVAREEALEKSCGLFFAPERLGFGEKSWALFWAEKKFTQPWLLSLQQLKPETKIKIPELLTAFQQLRTFKRFSLIESRLLGVVLSGTASVASREFGGLLRAKTYTWDDELDASKFVGGFAGYLQDGTIAWYQGAGSSKEAIREARSALLPLLEAHRSGQEGGCVTVKHAARHPLKDIIDSATGLPASAGPLSGSFTAKYERGTSLSFTSAGQLELVREKSAGNSIPRLIGHYSLNEYVARVLQREAKTTPAEAAKALAIVARSFLFQNGKKKNGCLEIADSSHLQRVSLEEPSSDALFVASFTSPLVLTGARARYHSSRASANVLSWEESVNLASAGYKYDELLKRSFPGAQLTAAAIEGGRGICVPLALASSWLKRSLPRWHRQLSHLHGFEPPRDPEICATKTAKPWADPALDRIYLSAFRDSEDELSLTHEYLHLAFQKHPLGLDETYVEGLAQSLVRLGGTTE